MLALALALAFVATDISWTDHSGQCPASRGRAPVEAAAQDFEGASIDIEVEATSDGLSAELTLETPHGGQTRTLQSPACDTLIEAAVLITRAAAMAAVVPEPPPGPEPEPETPPEPEPEPEPEVESDRESRVVDSSPPEPPAETRLPPKATPRLFGSARGFGFGTIGTTPGFGGGGGLAVGLGSTFWRAELTGAVAAPTTTEEQPGIRTWAWVVGARGCGTLDVRERRLQPGICGGLEVGEQLGEGTGTLVNRESQRGPWVAATVGPALRVFVVPGLALAAELEAVVSVLRPGFRIRNGALHEPNVVAPRASLGLELQLPRR